MTDEQYARMNHQFLNDEPLVISNQQPDLYGSKEAAAILAYNPALDEINPDLENEVNKYFQNDDHAVEIHDFDQKRKSKKKRRIEQDDDFFVNA